MKGRKTEGRAKIISGALASVSREASGQSQIQKKQAALGAHAGPQLATVSIKRKGPDTKLAQQKAEGTWTGTMRSTGAAIIRDGLGSTSISTKLEAAGKHHWDQGGGLSFLDATHPRSMYLNPTLSIINYAASRVFCPFEDKIPGSCTRTANDLDSASCMPTPHPGKPALPFDSCVSSAAVVHGSRSGRCSRLPAPLKRSSCYLC